MLTEIPCRHTLLYLSRSSEELLWLHREAVFPDPATWEAVWEAFRGIPVITRRRAAPGELIPVGVSLPIRRDGGRWRMASQVPLDGVTKAVSAVQAAEMCAEGSLPFSGLVTQLLRQVPRYGAAAGLFGSAALEAGYRSALLPLRFRSGCTAPAPRGRGSPSSGRSATPAGGKMEPAHRRGGGPGQRAIWKTGGAAVRLWYYPGQRRFSPCFVFYPRCPGIPGQQR